MVRPAERPPGDRLRLRRTVILGFIGIILVGLLVIALLGVWYAVGEPGFRGW